MKNISVIKIEPVNFSIKNKEEKALIIGQFQRFLNSLDFPIQIYITTDTLNLDTYLAKLEERTHVDYTLLVEDFRKHLQSLIHSQNLINRSFYLVIPEKESVGLQIQI